MKRIALAATVAALLPLTAFAQEAVGHLTLNLEGEERDFVMIQGADGPNPGSRYSRLVGDVVLTLVAVEGDEPMKPQDAGETVELRFTASEQGEVRTGSVLSYSTLDTEGMPSTRGGTVEITLESLDSQNGVSASGTFVAQLPPDQESAAVEVEGSFETALPPRNAPDS